MSQQNDQPRYPRQQWKIDTDPLIEKLINSNKRNLHGIDTMAWMLHIVGRLQGGRFDRRDLTNIISSFLDQSRELLANGRSYCRESLKALLLLKHAPAAGALTRSGWKDELAHNRLQLETLIRHNPSMKPFVAPMIRYAWRSARANAANTLTFGLYITADLRNEVLAEQRRIGKWNSRLPEQCPWSVEKIIGFSLDNHYGILANSRTVPFEEPVNFD